MSRSIAAEIAHLHADVRKKNNDELYEEYQIVVNDDKTVYDEVYEKKFSNMTEWVKFYGTLLATDDLDEDDYGYSGQFDDE